MLKLAADENFKQQVVYGLRRKVHDLDILTIRNAGLRGIPDPEVLAWAAEEGRILLTHDTRTIGGYALERVGNGQPMPGVVEVPDLMPIGQAIEEILLIAQLAEPEEIRDRVLRVPL